MDATSNTSDQPAGAAMALRAKASTLAALEALVLKKGVSLGRLTQADLLLVLAFASLCIPESGRLSEAEANEALKAWLAGDGSSLRIDHVELRRTLIDLAFWKRDGYGRAYWREPLDPEHPAYEPWLALKAIDVPALVAEARARRDRQRAERELAFRRGC